MIPDLTPWDGIVPIFNDLVIAFGVGMYWLGTRRRRKASTSLVKA